MEPHVSAGGLIAILNFVRRVPKLWDLANWEAGLEKKAQLLATQESELTTLRSVDTEFRARPDRTVSIDFQNPVTVYWRSESRVQFQVLVTVVNKWVYPIELTKMTGAFRFESLHQSSDSGALSELDNHRIDGLSAFGLPFNIQYLLDRQENESFLNVARKGDWMPINLNVRAYLHRQETEFQVQSQGQITATLVLPPWASQSGSDAPR